MKVSGHRSGSNKSYRDPVDRELSTAKMPRVPISVPISKYADVENKTLTRMKSEALLEEEHQRMIAERRVKDHYRSAIPAARFSDSMCRRSS